LGSVCRFCIEIFWAVTGISWWSHRKTNLAASYKVWRPRSR